MTRGVNRTPQLKQGYFLWVQFFSCSVILYTSSSHHLHFCGVSVSMVWPRSLNLSLTSSLSTRRCSDGEWTISVSSINSLSLFVSCSSSDLSSSLITIVSSKESERSDKLFIFFLLGKNFFNPGGVGLYFLLLQACFPNRSNFFLQNLHVSFFLWPLGGLAGGSLFLHTSRCFFSLSALNSFWQRSQGISCVCWAWKK